MKRLIALLLCLLLTGCAVQSPVNTATEVVTPAETEAPSAGEEPLDDPAAPDSFGLAYLPEYGLNPYSCMCLTNRPILSLLYEGLFVLNNRFEPEPVLCNRFAVSDNGRTYVLELCEDACFSDGSKVTARDVVASLYAAKGSDYYGTRFAQVDAIGAQDDRTVVITLLTPYENLPLLLDVPIVKAGTSDDDVPVGSGPYRLSNNKLIRSRLWWRDAISPVDQSIIYLNNVSTPAEVRDSFEFGGTTLVCVDLNAPAAVGYRCDYELWDCPTTAMQYLGFNLTTGICADPVFRAGITHLIDRESFIASIYKGFATAACLPCAQASPLYDTRLAAQYSYDPDAFAKALRMSSVGREFTGTLLVCSADTTRVELAHMLADAFAEYDLKITVNAVDYETYMHYLSIGNFDMFIGETRLSGNFDLTEFFKPYGALGYGGLASYDATQLCMAALENSGNYYDLHKKVMDEGLFCPLLFKSYAVMVNRGAISNLQSSVDNVFHLPGGRTLADATVPYDELAYGLTAPEESEAPVDE